MKVKEPLFDYISPNLEHQVKQGDCLTVLKSNQPEKIEHPCQFLIEFVERCVIALNNEGSFVVNQFTEKMIFSNHEILNMISLN